ncbi:MAG: rRNA maturation RNase YbeY, partial [Acidobacteriaceae bacterium]
TDVLSFPAPESLNGHRPPAGDIAISVETAARQAGEFEHPLATELQILALHGLLHLGGFDHESDNGRMARKETALRRRFGLAASLIERSTKPARKKGSRKP